MDVHCPYCRESIERRPDGVRCELCATPYHRACWDENGGRCAIAGCAGVATRPFTRTAAMKIVLGAGREALRDTNRRLGAKTAVLLLVLSAALVSSTAGVAAIPMFATHPARLGATLGGLFVVLLVWIAALLHRGTHLHDDMDVQVAGQGVSDYYDRLWRGLGLRGEGSSPSLSGCGDLGCDGCGGLDGEGAAVLAVVLVGIVVVAAAVVLLGPLLAWIALELVWPLIALVVYGILHAALALAVNGNHRCEGDLLRSLVRGALFAALYTACVGLAVEGILRLVALFR